MKPRKVAAWIALILLIPLVIAIVAGYSVEQIKGMTPGQIAAAMWHPIGSAISVTVGGTLAWLTAPVQWAHETVLILVVVLAGLVYYLRRVWKDTERANRLIFWDSLGTLTDQVTKLQELHRQVAEDKIQAEPVIEDFEPNRVQWIATKTLIDRYPKRLQLPDLAQDMKRYGGGGPMEIPIAPQGKIARELEVLHGRGVVTIDDPNSPMAYYGLTRLGRNLMLEKQHPKPAKSPSGAKGVSALRSLANPKDEP
jgi:hypothetical protein